jgi:hypothetical protein
MLPWLT